MMVCYVHTSIYFYIRKIRNIKFIQNQIIVLFLIIRKQFTSLSILFTVISLPINSFPPTDQQGDYRWLDSFSLVIHVWNIFLTLCSSSIIYMPVSFHINYIRFWLEVVQIIQIQSSESQDCLYIWCHQ